VTALVTKRDNVLSMAVQDAIAKDLPLDSLSSSKKDYANVSLVVMGLCCWLCCYLPDCSGCNLFVCLIVCLLLVNVSRHVIFILFLLLVQSKAEGGADLHLGGAGGQDARSELSDQRHAAQRLRQQGQC
jgi:hypothetical protein